MKHFKLGDLFTSGDIDRALGIWNEEEHPHARLRDEVVLPAMERINRVTGQENDPDYMAYMLEHVFNSAGGAP